MVKRSQASEDNKVHNIFRKKICISKIEVRKTIILIAMFEKKYFFL